jgi:propionyl-CoA carboxylase alpha chain
VVLSEDQDVLRIGFPDEARTLILETFGWRPGVPLFRGRLDGREFTATVSRAVEGFRVRHRAASLKVLVLTPTSADLHERLPEKTPPDTSRLVLSPMPGLVVSMDVAPGETVEEGQVLCVIEAMKMQNILRAERDGVIRTVGAKAGDSVAADDVLAEFA